MASSIFSSAGSSGILASTRISLTRLSTVAGTVAELGLLAVRLREEVRLAGEVRLLAEVPLLAEVASVVQGFLTTQGLIGCVCWVATP